MQQYRLFKLLLKPSLFSGVASSLTGCFILGFGNWLYATRSSFFGEYLFGRFGLVTTLQHSQGNLWSVVLDVFDKPFSYNIIVLLIAIVCGVIVYISLESVTRSVDSVHETWEEIHFAQGSSRRLMEAQLGTRWIIRLAALVGWIVYWIVWLSVIIPFCLIASRAIFDDAASINAWLYAGLGLIIAIVSIHLHVIFVRLILLRPRVFGSLLDMEIETLSGH